MNAIGIIYPEYWEAANAKVTFVGHLEVLKAKFCHPESKSPNATLVVGLLDGALLDQQASFLTITMKNNSHGALHPPLDYNPITKMWAGLATNVIVAQKLSKFLKLV
jgi:hypothetical protein